MAYAAVRASRHRVPGDARRQRHPFHKHQGRRSTRKGLPMTTIPGMKQRLRSGETLAGYLATIPSAVSVQAIAAAGADWVVIDQEHGAVGPESLHAMIAATAGTPCAPLVRVPKRDEALGQAGPRPRRRGHRVPPGRHRRGGGRLRRPHALPAARPARLGAFRRARALGRRTVRTTCRNAATRSSACC